MTFTFDPDREVAAAFQAIVPAGIATSDELLDALASVLNLPDYFGSNWDALESVLGI